MPEPRFDAYRWTGGEEAMLRFGPNTGTPLVAVAPLFEEANRTRATMIGVMRLLGQRGIACALPDLPGQGESLVPTEATDLDTLRAALAAAVEAIGGRPILVWSIRGGALIDDAVPAAARWRLSPVLAGRDLVRELARTRQAATGERSLPDLAAASGTIEIAGNMIAPAMLRQLAMATARRPARTVRLADDRREADHRVPGAPPWRAAEPVDDLGLVHRLADDITRWVATCAG